MTAAFTNFYAGETSCGEECIMKNYRTDYNIDMLRDIGKAAQPCYKPMTAPDPGIWTQRLRPTQMRVLRIEPGELNTTISTALLVATMTFYDGIELDDTKEIITYDALSYSWGYSTETASIQCNERPISVLKTLYEALYHLRLRDKAIHIWIDALCINQADAIEKGAQVSRMSSIFYKAEKVIAYLGIPHESASTALQLLREVSLAGHGAPCCEGLKHLLFSVQVLLKAPYFRRTWVRQEVFMANKLLVQINSVRMGWTDFVRRTTELLNLGQSIPPAMINPDESGLSEPVPASLLLLQQGSSDAKAKVVLESVHFLGSESRGLEVALRGSCHFEATDPRDFIYGVASMTTTNLIHTPLSTSKPISGAKEGIRIDYRQSLNVIYQDTTVYLMQKARSFDPIFFAHETRKQSDLLETLPSWCPDWSLFPEHSVIDSIWTNVRYAQGPHQYQDDTALSCSIVPVHERARLGSDRVPWFTDGAQIAGIGCIIGRVKQSSESLVSKWLSMDLGDEYVPVEIATTDSKPEIYSPPDPALDLTLSAVVKQMGQRGGAAPRSWREGDVVGYIKSTSLPAVLRPVATGVPNCFRLVGPLMSNDWINCLSMTFSGWWGKTQMKGTDRPSGRTWADVLDGIEDVIDHIEDLPMQEIVLI